MPELDPLSQQLGMIQGTLVALNQSILELHNDMDRRFRDVWARIGVIERSGWRTKAGYTTGGGVIVAAVELVRHFVSFGVK